jgi:serine O-acetyltransferase
MKNYNLSTKYGFGTKLKRQLTDSSTLPSPILHKGGDTGLNKIESNEDYLFFLEADRIALDIKRTHPKFIGDDIWKFQRLLRKLEYVTNCKRGLFWSIYKKYLEYKHYKACKNLRIYIPPNVFGAGFSISSAAACGITVNPKTKAGANVRLSAGVTIGSSNKSDTPPTIGNYVFFGPHSTVVGNVIIADGTAIGANSYVNRSFLEPNNTIAGCPAKVVSHHGARTVSYDAITILLRTKGENQS